jgi:hypothetical protein
LGAITAPDHILRRLGLSRIAAAVLAAYAFFCFSFSILLPTEESLLALSENGGWIYLINAAAIVIVYACSCEFRRPKVLFHHREYWVMFGFVFASQLIYLFVSHSFGRVKSLIPLFHPYGIDPLLHYLETSLFLGVSPSQWWVQEVPAYITHAFAYGYMPVWVIAIQAYFIWQLCKSPDEARTQFISCFLLLWIIAGILFATLFSSVGPIYYPEFYADANSAGYRQMIERLLANPDAFTQKMYVDIRQMLLIFYHDHSIVDINAISAMPSLHTGVAFLMTLHSHHYTRYLRYGMYPFALFIFIGSFALGWHYILDSVASALLVYAIWQLNLHSLRRAQATSRPSRKCASTPPRSPAAPKAVRW